VISIKKVTHHVGVSELPDNMKSDREVARGWLLGVFPSTDHPAGAAALARLLTGAEPLDQSVRELLAEEVKLAALGRGRVIKFKSRKARMDPHRDLFITWAVWERFLANYPMNPQYRIKHAQADIAREIGCGDKIVKNAWEKWQRRLKLPLKEK
jgi:hypothetical protein